MAYIRKDYYEGLYGTIPDADFTRLSWEACRYVDIHTTGIDNVKKLKLYFPTDEDNAEAVKRCVSSIVHFLHQVSQAEIASLSASGFEATEQGMRGKVISSVSSGNESISYATGSTSQATAIDAAVKDKTVRESMIGNIVWEYLSGVEDANGVNLLFMGRYPRRY